MADKHIPVIVMANTRQFRLPPDDIALVKQICLPYKVIASNMGLELGNIKMKVKRIMELLGVENRASLVVKAIRIGLVAEKDFVVRLYGKN